jgi:RNA polymerase sigma factor (sigma-70 family)
VKKPATPTRTSASATSRAALATLMEQHAVFRRFLIARLGSETDADDILQKSLLRVIERGVALRRNERVVAWFYRVLRNALVDHYRQTSAERRRLERLAGELSVGDADVVTPAAGWEAAVCACFHGLLPALKPRYAELIRRVDLEGEPKASVAADLKLSRAAFDVALHRARQALRRQIELLCGACSQAGCLACECSPETPKKTSVRTERKRV